MRKIAWAYIGLYSDVNSILQNLVLGASSHLLHEHPILFSSFLLCYERYRNKIRGNLWLYCCHI